MPKIFRISKVKSTYERDSKGGIILIIESPSTSGSVKRRPVINWLETLPLISMSPLFSLPSIIIPSSVYFSVRPWF